MNDIVTDARLLRTPCEPVKSKAEGGEIARKLAGVVDRLNKRAHKRGRSIRVAKGLDTSPLIALGLAAPQIGISKQVCLLCIPGMPPTVLMNPVIVEHSSVKIPYDEACLSLPGQQARTYRWYWVTVEALNLLEPVTFGIKVPPSDGRVQSTLLAAVVCQHECDHLIGVLMTDRQEDLSGNQNNYLSDLRCVRPAID